MRFFLLLVTLLGMATLAAAQTPTPTATRTPRPTNTSAPTATRTAQTLAQVQALVDSRVTNTHTAVTTRQAAYLAANGRYFQGVPWSNSPPVNGADVVPDYTRKPHYQPDNWQDVLNGIFRASEPMQESIDNYDGPLGKGWVRCSKITHTGVTYVKCTNTGPESWRTFNWRVARTVP